MTPTTTKPVWSPMRSVTRTSPDGSASGSFLQRAANVQGRQHGAPRVILVGDRRAEERHEAIAQELVHRPLVAVHVGQRQLEEPAQQHVHGVRAQPLRQPGGADDVAEQHADGLPLALHGAARGQDLLGEVPRRVRLGRR